MTFLKKCNKYFIINFFLVLLLGELLSSPVISQEVTSLQVAGWVERAMLLPGEVEVKAKLDTGAENSSINASDIELFTQNGHSWARFNFTNYKGKTIKLEKPIVRYAKIKRHFGASQKRPVIELEICIGSIHKNVEVNLVDRTGLNYQLLVGRNFLANDILIDSARKFKLQSGCSK